MMNNSRINPYPPYHGMQPNKQALALHNTDCNTLFDIIEKTSFAMDDTRLFLDTHPECQDALDFFNQMAETRKKAIAEYEAHYGPLISYHGTCDCGDNWLWNNGPLPWENACCNGRRV